MNRGVSNRAPSVPDSRSGPQRAACDLGMLSVHADRKSKRADGTAYEPVTIRIVASRYPRSGTANRGRVIDGWQVELYAVDAEADAWPAPDADASKWILISPPSLPPNGSSAAVECSDVNCTGCSACPCAASRYRASK